VELLRSAGSVSVAELETRFGVSSMTARRDLAALERQGVARRTHGGAVLPGVAAHEDSFAQRVERDSEAKRALADEAVSLIAPRQTIFLDSSSTAYYVAQRVVDDRLALTVITNSLPVMELIGMAEHPDLELIGIGGTFRKLTHSFVGPVAVQAVLGHFADRLFLSVKGVSGDGILTDADPLEAEVKRAMIAHAEESVLLVDSSKLSSRGLSAICPVADLSSVLTYGVAPEQVGPLRAEGVALHPVEREAAS
jgi:DeoR/GlpR family transcriptional regulator of sugar metabolism